MKFKLYSGGSVVQSKSGWLTAAWGSLPRSSEFSDIVLDKQSWFRYSLTKLNSVASQYCPVSCIQWNKYGHSNVYHVFSESSRSVSCVLYSLSYILHFVSLFCIMYFAFCILYPVQYYLFCILHSVLCVLYCYVSCILHSAFCH